MKFKKIWLSVLSLCFVGALLPGVAHAGTANATVTTETSDDILWVVASVEQPQVKSLEIRILTPRTKGEGRKVFQRCIFNFQGTGDYRCGIDVAAGSIATKHQGEWITKVLIDGAVSARTEFSL